MPSTSAPPDLRVSLGSRLDLPTPIVAASGAYGYGEEVRDFGGSRDPGALITPTLTVAPRAGNPMPRTAEATAGLLHSLGWPNPGLDSFISDRLPGLRSLPYPVIASIHGETLDEWRILAGNLTAEGGVVALELNLSKVSRAGEASILGSIEEAVAAVRAETDLTLIAKLPAANVEIGAAARIAEDAGADVIAVSQGFPGVAVRLSSRKFRLPGVAGELSGPCIKPLALYQVWRAAQSVACPILASGGIMTGEDALEFLAAGASAVAIGIASSIHPTAIATITADLSAYLASHHLSSPSNLTGAALRHR